VPVHPRYGGSPLGELIVGGSAWGECRRPRQEKEHRAAAATDHLMRDRIDSTKNRCEVCSSRMQRQYVHPVPKLSWSSMKELVSGTGSERR